MSYNAWLYVRNNPIRFIDPSGHCIYSDGSVYRAGYPYGTGGMCPDPSLEDPIPLTHTGEQAVTEDGKAFSRAMGGAEVYAIYRQFQTTCGWWNDYCNTTFEIREFVGMWAMFESNGNAEVAGVIATIIAQNLYIGGNNPPACPGGSCFNGIFNFMGAYSKGVGRVFKGPNNKSVQQGCTDYPSVWHGPVALRTTLFNLGDKALSRSSLDPTWDRWTGPSNWGNVKGGHGSWLEAVREAAKTQTDPPIREYHINGTAKDTIYYYFNNAFYYSRAQKHYWTVEKGASAGMAENGETAP